MPITTREPAPPSPLQRFRAITEGYLMYVAQREMLRQYAADDRPPVPKHGAIYRLLPWLFLPGFRLTPWPLRRRLLSRFFVQPAQRWPERPWRQPRG